MKTKDLIKYFFSCGAIIYTAGSALILSVSLLLANNPESTVIVPKPFLLYLAFSYIISLGNTLFKIEKIPSVARRIIHFSSYVIALFAFLMLCGMRFEVAIIASVALGVIYIISIIITKLSKGGLKLVPHKTAKTDEKPAGTNKRSPKNNNSTTYKNRFS